MLSTKALAEYKLIYKQKYGKEISAEEANLQATALLRLFKLIYKPIPISPPKRSPNG